MVEFRNLVGTGIALVSKKAAVKVGVEKMTRNCRKMIEKTEDSLLLSKHSIQFSVLFLLLSGLCMFLPLHNVGIFQHPHFL